MKETNQAIRRALTGENLDQTRAGFAAAGKQTPLPQENLIYPPKVTWGPLPHVFLAVINPTE